MNRDSYFYLLWKNFGNVRSLIAGFCSFILSFVFWIWKPEQKISLAVCITIGVIIIFLLLVFIRFSVVLYDNKKQDCIILRIRETYGIYKSDDCVIMLTTYIEYFAENGIVSIFYLENEFERLIALGQIINIQEDKKVQILMFDIDKEFSCEKLLKNESDLLKKLRVKPIVKFNSLEVFQYGK